MHLTSDRLGRRALAVGGTLLVLTAMATSAQAADGPFTYLRSDTGASAALDNPPDDACLPLSGGARHVSNGTDATAFVYADGLCLQLVAVVDVGDGWDAAAQPAESVRFSLH